MARTQIARFHGPSQPWPETPQWTFPAVLHTSARRDWGGHDASGSPGSSVSTVLNENPKSQQHRDEGYHSKEMLSPPGWRRCSGAASSGSPGTFLPRQALAQHGAPEVFAVTQQNDDGTSRCTGPFTCPAVTAGQDCQCVTVEKWIRVRALPGILPTAVN